MMSMKNIGIILLAGSLLAAPAVAAWVYPHPASEVAAPDTKAVPVVQSTVESSPTITADPNDPIPVDPNDLIPVEVSCIWGVSKNLCEGKLTGGQWTVSRCGECVTLVGKEASLRINMYHNMDPCCDFSIVPCDEAEDLGSVFAGTGEYHIRLNGPCPVRGWWKTSWMTYDLTAPQLTARGSLDGTMGTGTHRIPGPCRATIPAQPCGQECETCYMAEFDDSIEPGWWFIHVEGSMLGQVLSGDHEGCQVRVTMQGYFAAPADANGLPTPPDKLKAGWNFCGTVDGVLDCFCQ